MSSNGWTPGPWVLEPTPSGLAVEIFSGDDYICRTRIKDGALIAAAPALYAALEAAIPFLASHPADAVLSRLKDAEAALKKARGET